MIDQVGTTVGDSYIRTFACMDVESRIAQQFTLMRRRRSMDYGPCIEGYAALKAVRLQSRKSTCGPGVIGQDGP